MLSIIPSRASFKDSFCDRLVFRTVHTLKTYSEMILDLSLRPSFGILNRNSSLLGLDPIYSSSWNNINIANLKSN